MRERNKFSLQTRGVPVAALTGALATGFGNTTTEKEIEAVAQHCPF